MRNFNTLTLFNKIPTIPQYRSFNLADAFDTLEKDFFRDPISEGPTLSSYDLKLNSEKSQWELTMELAGVTKDNLKLDAKEGLLQINAEKTRGLNAGKFEQAFKLPQGLDYEKIEADFNDGVLFVTLPLAEQKSLKRISLK